MRRFRHYIKQCAVGEAAYIVRQSGRYSKKRWRHEEVVFKILQIYSPYRKTETQISLYYFAYDQLPKIRLGGRVKFYLCILRAASAKHQDLNSASKTERC